LKRGLKKLIKEFDRLKDDKSRFKFLIKHKDSFELRLDNDATYVVVADSITEHMSDDTYYSLPEINIFSGWLGNACGVGDLLEVIGIKSEHV